MILTITFNPCLDRTITLPHALGRTKKNHGGVAEVIVGGKGNNVARFLRRLGMADVVPFNFVAGATGERTIEILRAEGLAPVFFAGRKGETRTITTMREPDGTYTPVFEPGPEISRSELAELKRRLFALLTDADHVVIGGSAANGPLGMLFPAIVRTCRRRGTPVYLDAHGVGFVAAVRERPDFIKPNDDEVRANFGQALLRERDYFAFLERAAFEFRIPVAVVTCGPRPFYLAFPNGFVKIFPPKVREVYPVGSGDAFVAGYLAARVAGADPLAAAIYGAAAGASNAARWPMSALEKRELERLGRRCKIGKIRRRE